MKEVNKQDAYVWVLKVIKSCETLSQWAKSRRLVNLHYNRFEDFFLYEVMNLEHRRQLEKLNKV